MCLYGKVDLIARGVSIQHNSGKSMKMKHIDALSWHPSNKCMIIDKDDSLTVKFKRAQEENNNIKKSLIQLKKITLMNI